MAFSRKFGRMKAGDKTVDFTVAYVWIFMEEEHGEPRGLDHYK